MLSNKNILIIKTPEELEEYIPAWENLVKNATDENIFFEPSILISALRYLNNEQAFILLIFADDTPKEQGLIGLFPLVSNKKYKGLPIPHLSIWQTQQCFLGTPLVHKDYTQICLEFLFKWLEYNSKYFLLFREFVDEGLFHKKIIKFINNHNNCIDEVEQYKRAFLLLESNLTKEEYIKQRIPKVWRKNWRNRSNAFNRLGKVNLTTLDQNNIFEENIDQWIQDFLQIEQSSWKGKKGTALACDENEKKYFIEITKNAAQQSKLLMFKLTLDDKIIAMQCNFISFNGVFAYKTSYYQKYRKYSPGILLNLEGLEYMFQTPQLLWIDSCAMPYSTMAKTLFQDQRAIRSFNISTQNWKSKLVVRLLSLFRKCYRKIGGLTKA